MQYSHYWSTRSSFIIFNLESYLLILGVMSVASAWTPVASSARTAVTSS
jgi:hypothetical protein